LDAAGTPRTGWVSRDGERDLGPARLRASKPWKQADQPGANAAPWRRCGIANQRETTLLCIAAAGTAAAPAIVWQDGPHRGLCADWKRNGLVSRFWCGAATGPCCCDPYFSASKIRVWLLREQPQAAALLRPGLCFGTVQQLACSWRLTARQVHATDR